MKRFLIFSGGLVAGIIATILFSYVSTISNKPIDNGLIGLTVFPEKGDCVKTSSTSKSTEIEILQVILPNVALATIKNYTDEKRYDGTNYRNYDIINDLVVLLINNNGKTYYDDQKIEVTNNCLRQIGTYQYTARIGIEKTVPAVTIE